MELNFIKPREMNFKNAFRLKHKLFDTIYKVVPDNKGGVCVFLEDGSPTATRFSNYEDAAEFFQADTGWFVVSECTVESALSDLETYIAEIAKKEYLDNPKFPTKEDEQDIFCVVLDGNCCDSVEATIKNDELFDRIRTFTEDEYKGNCVDFVGDTVEVFWGPLSKTFFTNTREELIRVIDALEYLEGF